TKLLRRLPPARRGNAERTLRQLRGPGALPSAEGGVDRSSSLSQPPRMGGAAQLERLRQLSPRARLLVVSLVCQRRRPGYRRHGQSGPRREPPPQQLQEPLLQGAAQERPRVSDLSRSSRPAAQGVPVKRHELQRRDPNRR